MATQTETRLEQPETIELSSSPPQDNDGSSQPPDHDARLRRATYLRIASASFSFFVAGVNDGSLGAIIPYVIRQYAITTAIVSSVYGATFAGWAFAALTNTHLCQYLDTGSMLLLGAVCQVVAHVLRSWMPPFGLFVVTFFLVAVGQAYNDTHANTFVAGVKGAHRWLAVIHASYMVSLS